MEALETFSQKLQQAQEDWPSVQAIFSDHFGSRFLHDFITRELSAAADDPAHVVPKSVGPANFTIINTMSFEYSVRILIPFPARPHPVKWLGMRQIVGVKGAGPMTVRRFRVPSHFNITFFQPGVAIEDVEFITAADRDVIAAASPHEMLDIHEISAPVVVEVLTYRRDDSGFLWNFDQDLRSLYAEQSSLTLSRFRNVLELAHAAGKPVPDDIYDLALNPSRPYVALLAIRSMLMSGHPEAFAELQQAMDSAVLDLSQGAQRLFDSMMMARGSDHAT